jgi:hypothetical protein
LSNPSLLLIFLPKSGRWAHILPFLASKNSYHAVFEEKVAEKFGGFAET